MLFSSQNRHVRYGSTFLTVLGAGIAGGMYTSWATAHAMPETAALVSAIGTLGSIAGKEGKFFHSIYIYLPLRVQLHGCTCEGMLFLG
jgi:hypothetical protein